MIDSLIEHITAMRASPNPDAAEEQWLTGWEDATGEMLRLLLTIQSLNGVRKTLAQKIPPGVGPLFQRAEGQVLAAEEVAGGPVPE